MSSVCIIDGACMVQILLYVCFITNPGSKMLVPWTAIWKVIFDLFIFHLLLLYQPHIGLFKLHICNHTRLFGNTALFREPFITKCYDKIFNLHFSKMRLFQICQIYRQGRSERMCWHTMFIWMRISPVDHCVLFYRTVFSGFHFLALVIGWIGQTWFVITKHTPITGENLS